MLTAIPRPKPDRSFVFTKEMWQHHESNPSHIAVQATCSRDFDLVGTTNSILQSIRSGWGKHRSNQQAKVYLLLHVQGHVVNGNFDKMMETLLLSVLLDVLIDRNYLHTVYAYAHPDSKEESPLAVKIISPGDDWSVRLPEKMQARLHVTADGEFFFLGT